MTINIPDFMPVLSGGAHNNVANLTHALARSTP